tara:strand:+ start:554 stop:811 length:258 start_codon:yes stop_codon:yes gene_type:complete
MRKITEEIRKESAYNSYDKETLVDMLIETKQDLRIEKALAEWLDTLATSLREEGNEKEVQELRDKAKELLWRYKETKKQIQKTRI